MKKVLLFSMIAIAGLTVSAVDMTKEVYIAKIKAVAERKGRAFDAEKVAADFDKLDKNKDGVWSDEEQGKVPAKPKAPAAE